MRNTWAICREVGDNLLKGELIPNVTVWRHLWTVEVGDNLLKGELIPNVTVWRHLWTVEVGDRKA